MCGSRSGIIFFYCSFSLFLLCLAPDAFAVLSSSNGGIQSTGRSFTASPSSDGSWRVRDAQIPEGRYYPSEMPNPVGGSSGIGDLWSTPNLPVPSSSDVIPGISEADLVSYGDVAAAAAPFLAQLAGLSPQGRAAITGASALWALYQSLYSSGSGSSVPDIPATASNLPASGCGSGMYWEWTFVSFTAPSGTPGVYLYPVGSIFPESVTSAGVLAASGGWPDGAGPGASYCPSDGIPNFPAGSTPQSLANKALQPASSVPSVPSASSLSQALAANPSKAGPFLQALPQSVSNTIPMQQAATGPSSVPGSATKTSSQYSALPSNLSQPSTASGSVPVTKTVTSTPIYTPTYNPTNGSVTVSKTVNQVTKICTAAGSCTVTNISTSPSSIPTPFVSPTAIYPKVSTVVPTNSVPFTPFSFGAPWLPKICPAAPTFQVCAIGGVDCQTEKLPTNVICQLASGIEPIVTTGGGLLGLLILAW
ncbi:MAG: hypothetical protein ACYDDP_01810 [Acidithiobacillus sp.]